MKSSKHGFKCCMRSRKRASLFISSGSTSSQHSVITACLVICFNHRIHVLINILLLYTIYLSVVLLIIRREHDKKVCILGLASLLAVPSAAMPHELQAGLDQVYKALLKLLVAYKDQLAGKHFHSLVSARS